MLDEQPRASHSELMALVEIGGVDPQRAGYTGRPDACNVIGRSNGYSVVVCGIGTQESDNLWVRSPTDFREHNLGSYERRESAAYRIR